MTKKPVVGKIVWHDLVTPEPDKASEFYKKLIGWEYTDFDMGSAGNYTMIQVGEKTIGGFMKPTTGNPPPHWSAYGSVADVDKTLEIIRNLEGKIIIEGTDIPNVGRFAVFADPQGAAMCLFKGIEPDSAEQPRPHHKEFCWEELLTDDVDAAKGFYGEVFGWSYEMRDMGPMGSYAVAKRGECQTAGIMKKPAQVPAPPHWLTYIYVDDIDGTIAKVEGLGGKILRPVMDVPEVGRISTVQDSQGAVIGLFGDFEEASQ